MGRAIDMENSISALMLRVEKLENTVRGMVSELDGLNEKSSKTIKVDLTEDVKESDEKEKTDNEGNDGGSVKPNKRRSGSKKSSDKS